jgi:hypothetical protein
MTHDEKISQMARYMDKHGSRTEYDMRTGKSEHKPATMSFEDFRKSEKKPSPARSKALEKKRMKLSEKIGNRAWPGLMEHNNAAAMSIDKHNRGEKTEKGCGIKGCKYDD